MIRAGVIQGRAAVSPWQRSERGSGTMLMVGIMVVVVMFSLAGVCIAGYLVGVHRVRAAADLAALSGASALVADRDGCAAARRNARANDAQVVSCEHVGDAIDFVITVRAEVTVAITVPGLPHRISAVAYAGSGAQ